jgi:HrpA-like RNA helicase
MDKDYLSRKRNKPEHQEKPSNSHSNSSYKPNPFFDFSDNVTMQEKLNSTDKYNQNDYSRQRKDNSQQYQNFNNDSRNTYSYQRNYDSKNYNYKGKYDTKGNYKQNHNADIHPNNQKEYLNIGRSEDSVETNSNSTKRLPIERYRDVILNYIKNNQVLVIAGETGCGKTTQVPKYIFEDYVKRNDNTLNMIITQPRRIAAVSIAKRLSEELGVINGKEVGYHVGRSPVFDSERTKILIVTTGIFLQRLIHEKELPNVSHVILDEVHERDIDIDFVMILIKHILKKHSNLKLILMSATISTYLFANYFSKENIEKIDDLDYYRNVSIKHVKEVPQQDLSWDNLPEKKPEKSNRDSWETSGDWAYTPPRNSYSSAKASRKLEERNESLFMNENESNRAPIVKVDEKIYPVKIEYLKEIIEKYVDREFARRLPAEFQFEKIAPRIADYIFDIAAMLIKMIHTDDRTRNYYSILVFLPGFFEIQCMNEKILSTMDKEDQEIEILQLHSGISE